MSFLAALAKNQVKKGSVIPLIEQHLLTTTLSEDRRDKHFHPSDLSGPFCPRAWSLYNYHPEGFTVKEASVDPRLGRIFDNGHGVHERIQKYLGAALWGKWEKLTGWDAADQPVYQVHVGYKPAGNGWRYGEVRLHHAGDRILGSTDGLLDLHGEKWGLEVKSINTDGFKWVTAGEKVMHRNQVLIYEHALAAEHGAKKVQRRFVDAFDMRPLKGFIVLYENKNDQTLKEHIVDFDQAEVDSFLAGKRLYMDEALEFERSGEHPECRCTPGKKSALCKAFPEGAVTGQALRGVA